MSENPVICLVCGYERGGTTLVSELIRQNPEVDGRFECGFLLVEEIADFLDLHPYARNIKIAWGLSQEDLEYICAADSYLIAYQRLLERSNIPNKQNRIYDKTPRYMRYLTTAMEKIDVPVVCVVRDPRALYWSAQKHWDQERLLIKKYNRVFVSLTDETRPRWLHNLAQRYFQHQSYWNRLNDFCTYYANYAEEWRKANERFPGKILLVQHEKVCTDPKTETQRIYDFLGLEFREGYLALPNKPDQYVDRGGILPNVVHEYRTGLSHRAEKYLLRNTQEYAQWHWDAE